MLHVTIILISLAYYNFYINFYMNCNASLETFTLRFFTKA